MYSLDPRAGSPPHRPCRRPKGGELSAQVPPGGVLPEAEGGGEEGREGGEIGRYSAEEGLCATHTPLKSNISGDCQVQMF